MGTGESAHGKHGCTLGTHKTQLHSPWGLCCSKFWAKIAWRRGFWVAALSFHPAVRPLWLQGIPRLTSSTSVRDIEGGSEGGWSCLSTVLQGLQGQQGFQGASGYTMLKSHSSRRCSLTLFSISKRTSCLSAPSPCQSGYVDQTAQRGPIAVTQIAVVWPITVKQQDSTL